jgi:hypothetical protein
MRVTKEGWPAGPGDLRHREERSDAAISLSNRLNNREYGNLYSSMEKMGIYEEVLKYSSFESSLYSGYSCSIPK